MWDMRNCQNIYTANKYLFRIRHGTMNELQLIQKCKSGDQKAMRLLYDRYADMLYNTIYRYVLNRHDTEDIVQISFCRVFKYLNSFDADKGNLKSWIRKIGIRCMINSRNKKKPLMFIDLEDPEIKDRSVDPISNLSFEQIKQLIYGLDDPFRTIFNMYEIEGFSHAEIAEMLQIKEGASRVYLSRAKIKLRSSIEKMDRKFRV